MHMWLINYVLVGSLRKNVKRYGPAVCVCVCFSPPPPPEVNGLPFYACQKRVSQKASSVDDAIITGDFRLQAVNFLWTAHIL